MGLKALIKRELNKRVDREYDLKLSNKRISYDSWIRELEGGLEQVDMSISPESAHNAGNASSYVTHYDGTTISIMPYNAVTKTFSFQNIIEDIIIFVNGELTARAVPLIVRAFRENPDCMVIYGDEDIAELAKEESTDYGKSVHGTRNNPYFKPAWSPNTFLDRFYFCNICAVRRVAFREINTENGLSGAELIYHTLLRYIYEQSERVNSAVLHIDEILVHASGYECAVIKDDRAGYISRGLKDGHYKKGFSLDNKAKLSVIIPSKDNSRLIDKCLTSFYDACPGTIEPEIIVVDNGSRLDEKDCYEALAGKYKFRYEYRPMEFNFPRMCNIGASLATGDYILFLNDDVTFTEPYTLENMLEQVSYTFVGAVGAKLLYPGSEKIQHAGVINNRIGPVHKLQFADDAIDYYFGFSHGVSNVLAVTGACLMIRSELYESAGGMSENLRVAFNDVDLCLKLFERGYHNVVCNNISLEHAESVSRGKDIDRESLKRLQRERSILYFEHPVFAANDPYYSKYLVSDCLDTRIVPAFEFEYKRAVEIPESVKLIDLNLVRNEDCIFLNIEWAGGLSDYLFDETKTELYVQGISFVTGSDNACYKRSLILKNRESGEAFAIPYEGALRNDVALNCPDQVNVDLSGFAIEFDKNFVPEGTYDVGILMEHKYAAERLCRFSERELVVK